MRILLVRAPVPPHTIGLKHIMVCEPLELEYVAAGLVGHDVQIMDLILERGFEWRLRTFRPDVLVAPDPTRWFAEDRTYVNHTDHRTVGQACAAVVSFDSSTRPVFSELLDEGLEPFEIKHLWIPTYDNDADTYVDVTETIELKIESLRAHASQIKDWPVDEWIRKRAAERGATQGMEYAECFKTFRLREEEED